jgi:serine/threonine protein kinase
MKAVEHTSFLPFPRTNSMHVLQHNVLIDNNGNALVADFGRSKIIDRRGFTTTFSGSARYMAPELLVPPFAELSQAEGGGGDYIPILTKKTDVYGFGMVALEVSPIHRR